MDPRLSPAIYGPSARRAGHKSRGKTDAHKLQSLVLAMRSNV